MKTILWSLCTIDTISLFSITLYLVITTYLST